MEGGVKRRDAETGFFQGCLLCFVGLENILKNIWKINMFAKMGVNQKTILFYKEKHVISETWIVFERDHWAVDSVGVFFSLR